MVFPCINRDLYIHETLLVMFVASYMHQLCNADFYPIIQNQNHNATAIFQCKINDNSYGKIKIEFARAKYCRGDSYIYCEYFTCECQDGTTWPRQNRAKSANNDNDYSLRCSKPVDLLAIMLGCTLGIPAFVMLCVIIRACNANAHERAREYAYEMSLQARNARATDTSTAVNTANSSNNYCVVNMSTNTLCSQNTLSKSNSEFSRKELACGNNVCGISYSTIEKNATYYKCLQCNFISDSNAFNQWYAINKTCPECRLDLSNIMFNQIMFVNSGEHYVLQTDC